MKRFLTLLKNSASAQGPALGLLVVVALAAYLNSLHAPWYFEDYRVIIDNPAIQDPWGLARELLTSGRALMLLTFTLNDTLGGLDPFWFHATNLAIHALTGCAVYLLCRRLTTHDPVIPLLLAVIFLVHPIQTQAVNYLVQRATCLAGLFFFLALYLYRNFRDLAPSGVDDWPTRGKLFYGLSIGFACLAVISKQNSVVLPVVIVAMDRLLFGEKLSLPYLKRLLPFLAISLCAVLLQIVLPVFRGADFATLGHSQALTTTQEVTVLHYFVTEWSVLWLYLKLLIVPYPLLLEYGYPVITRLFTVQNLAAGSALALVAFAGYRLRRREPLISFGLVWFFVTLAVESTFLPLDPVFEHRLYIPSFGFFLVVYGGLQRWLTGRQVKILFLLWIVPLLILTWQRNALWNDKLAFLEDNFRKAPHSERVAGMLVAEYIERNRFDDAIRVITAGLGANPQYIDFYDFLSHIHYERGEYQRSNEVLRAGLKVDDRHANLYRQLGKNYVQLGDAAKALEYYDTAIRIDPLYPKTYLSRGILYATGGDLARAESDFKKAIALTNVYPQAHNNLGQVYSQQGRLQEAQQEWLIGRRQAMQGSSRP